MVGQERSMEAICSSLQINQLELIGPASHNPHANFKELIAHVQLTYPTSSVESKYRLNGSAFSRIPTEDGKAKRKAARSAAVCDRAVEM